MLYESFLINNGDAYRFLQEPAQFVIERHLLSGNKYSF